MGIKDLLKNLEGATLQKNISDFSGKRLAVDASGWLHKAVFATAEDWVDSNFTDSQLYVDFVLTRVRNLQSCGITPVMVFDGKRNNLKSETRAKRDEGRIGNIENAKRLLESISKTSDPICRSKMRNECISCFQRGLGVTHEMEKNCLAALRKYNIDIIVAPYEADPQLAYLCHINYCDGVMTEDSDILVYSAVCGKPFPILYKFDKSGTVQITDLTLCGVFASPDEVPQYSSTLTTAESCNDLESECYGIGVAAEKVSAVSSKGKRKNTDSNGENVGKGSGSFLSQLQGHFKPSAVSAKATGEVCHLQGRRMFVHMCLLAGCDYSDSIPGVGLQTALQVVVRFKDTPSDQRLKKICDYFKLTNKRVADSYLPRILRAEQLFFYHPVYNPYSECIAHFTAPEMRGELSTTLSGPFITDTELFKLGADASEVLSLSKKDGAASCNTSMSSDDSSVTDASVINIRDVCKGCYSIKDHQEIVPRYPWEADGGRTSGTSSSWYMRRTLVNALGVTAQNKFTSNRAHTYSGSSHHTKPSTSSTNSIASNSGSVSMNAISSFMLGSTSRPSQQHPYNAARVEPTKPLVAGKTSSGYFLQSKLSQQHVISHTTSNSVQTHNASSSASTVYVHGQIQQSQGQSQQQGRIQSHRFDSFEFLSATKIAPAVLSSTDDMQTVYDLCEDSALDDADGAGVDSVPQNLANTISTSSACISMMESDSHHVQAGRDEPMSIYDVLDSPLVVKPASTASTAVGPGQTLGDAMMVENDVVDLTASPVPSRKHARLDLQSFRCGVSSACDEAPTSPSRLQLLLSPATDVRQQDHEHHGSVQHHLRQRALQQGPTATTKKSRYNTDIVAESPDFAHTLAAFAAPGREDSPAVPSSGSKSSIFSHSSVHPNGAQQPAVRRKILGPGRVVPVPIPRAPSATVHPSGAVLTGAFSESTSGEKRKHSYAAVPVPRKKIIKTQTTGSIMVPSIKSFFNAV